MEANAENLFHFETYRKLNLKPSNEGDNRNNCCLHFLLTSAEADVDPSVIYDDPNQWKVQFAGQTDSCPKGPSAFSLDVKFPLASDLYGLPEHSTSLSLPDTINQAGER